MFSRKNCVYSFFCCSFFESLYTKELKSLRFCVGAGNTIIGVDNGKFQFVGKEHLYVKTQNRLYLCP